MKQLKNILSDIEIIETVGSLDVSVNKICFDSRKVENDDIFVAIKGYSVDGHKFIEKAIQLGAKVIVCEDKPESFEKGITYLMVKDSSKTLGLIASNFYDNPTKNIVVVGVTGTNGKTTTATLLYNLFEHLGYKAGLISTVENIVHKEIIKATHTTPDPIQLQSLFAKMVQEGCQYAFMEVSSHAIHQNRIAGIHFAGGIFTNITHDHLDYHKTFLEYLNVKKSFFDNLPKTAFALVNIDDKNGEVMLQNTKAKKYTYSLKNPSDFKTKILEKHFNGMLLSINNTEVWTRFIGKFNAYNLTSVYATAILLNQQKEEVLLQLSKLTPVNGRFEYFVSDNGITAVVDYAHTPDALENVISSILEIKDSNSQLITVVGAGGNRDKTKRPLMAKICSKLSDKVILTSDNPRDENPEDIIKDMEFGIDAENRAKTISITNRKDAIKAAIMFAGKGDIVLVAGKGHETYQEIKGVKHHFDDKEVVKEFLNIK